MNISSLIALVVLFFCFLFFKSYFKKHKLSDGWKKHSYSDSFALMCGVTGLALLALYIGVFGNLDGEKSSILNIENEQVCIENIQGKWTGKFYTTYQGNKMWQVRFLIEGDKISYWVRLSEDEDTGYTKPWEDVRPKFERETIKVGYLKSKGEARELYVQDKNLMSKFLLYNSGTFLYDRHGLNKGWKP